MHIQLGLTYPCYNNNSYYEDHTNSDTAHCCNCPNNRTNTAAFRSCCVYRRRCHNNYGETEFTPNSKQYSHCTDNQSIVMQSHLEYTLTHIHWTPLLNTLHTTQIVSGSGVIKVLLPHTYLSSLYGKRCLSCYTWFMCYHPHLLLCILLSLHLCCYNLLYHATHY